MWGGLRAFSGPSIFTALLCRWRHFARVVFTCSCVKAFLLPAPPLPPSSLGGSSQGCHGYLHVRLRLFQFTQAPSPHPSIGDGLNRNVKYGSPCQFGSLGIFNQQLISIFTLGLSGWSIQKRRTRLRWKMSSCLVCRFLIFFKNTSSGSSVRKFGALFCHFWWGNLKFCKRHEPVHQGSFSWTPPVRICAVSYCDHGQTGTL